MKKSLEKSKNVPEKRKMVKRKICIKKTNTFQIIPMNFVQEPLNTHVAPQLLKAKSMQFRTFLKVLFIKQSLIR